MLKKYIMVISAGAIVIKATIYDEQFNIISKNSEKFTQYTPSSDRVEHDAMEIFQKSVRVCKQAIIEAGIGVEEILSLGITNQRSTCLVWDKTTGLPLARAITWQDSRTNPKCRELNAGTWGEKARKTMGWKVSPAYSSLSLNWYIQHVPIIKEKIETGEALFGTIDTWLIWKLTGGEKHLVSYSNASLMGSFQLRKEQWYTEFLETLGISTDIYPRVVNDSGDFGVVQADIFGCEIPIGSDIADQQAALFAVECNQRGICKIMNQAVSIIDIYIGNECIISDYGLNTVIAWNIDGNTKYALEGFDSETGSALQWLEEGIAIISDSLESEMIANEVADTGGVYFVPALAGLSVPYHDSMTRGTIFGINRGTTRAHLVRATLEGIVYRLKDILDAVEKEAWIKIDEIRVVGTDSKNDLLSQMMADILNARVDRPYLVEADSFSAAQLAGLAAGLWSFDDFKGALKIEKSFYPEISDAARQEKYVGWCEAVNRTLGWNDSRFQKGTTES
jgi:Glycerol kinase